MSVANARALFFDSGDNATRHYRESYKRRAYSTHPNRVCSSVNNYNQTAASAGWRSLSAWFDVVVNWMKLFGKHLVGICLFPERMQRLPVEHRLLIRGKAQSLEVHIERICQ